MKHNFSAGINNVFVIILRPRNYGNLLCEHEILRVSNS